MIETTTKAAGFSFGFNDEPTKTCGTTLRERANSASQMSPRGSSQGARYNGTSLSSGSVPLTFRRSPLHHSQFTLTARRDDASFQGKQHRWPKSTPVAAIMAAAASSPRQEHQRVTLTDLPTEILCQIFDHFKDARMERRGRVDWFRNKNYDDLEVKRAAVLNSRLACRRLREVASPMALPTVRVKLEQASLDRLDEISRIPEIAGSVRGIEVVFAYRSKRLATNFGEFIARRKGEINTLRFHEDGFEPFCHAEVKKAWDGYLKHSSICVSNNGHKAPIQNLYHEYQRRYDEQLRLLDSGAFVDAIVSAASRMPLFGSLLFDDNDIYEGHLTSDERKAPHLLTAAHRWRTLEALPDEVLPAQILSDLPVAIHKAGMSLREVSVNTFPRTVRSGHPLIRDAESLRLAFQDLEEVNFWLLDPGLYSKEVAGQLNGYLGALVSGRSLEHLTINANGDRRFSRPTREQSAIGPALSTLNAPHLRHVSLVLARFKQSEWDGFCEGLGGSLDELSISDVDISDGSWAPSIRVLRQKTASRCDNELCRVLLTKLKGGEFGDGSSEVILNWWDPQRNQDFML